MKVLVVICLVSLAVASEECGENSHYEDCGTLCPVTCDNFENPPMICFHMCNPGCHCDDGFVKAHDGSCVKPEGCTAIRSNEDNNEI